MKHLWKITLFIFCAGCTAGHADKKQPTSYEECIEAGHPVLKSLPPQCVTPDGTHFFKEESSHSICANHCGDGKCAEMVCQGAGCPCAESHDSCPHDCKGSDERADSHSR